MRINSDIRKSIGILEFDLKVIFDFIISSF